MILAVSDYASGIDGANDTRIFDVAGSLWGNLALAELVDIELVVKESSLHVVSPMALIFYVFVYALEDAWILILNFRQIWSGTSRTCITFISIDTAVDFFVYADLLITFHFIVKVAVILE